MLSSRSRCTARPFALRRRINVKMRVWWMVDGQRGHKKSSCVLDMEIKTTLRDRDQFSGWPELSNAGPQRDSPNNAFVLAELL
jgi:hypothetical protein